MNQPFTQLGPFLIFLYFITRVRDSTVKIYLTENVRSNLDWITFSRLRRVFYILNISSSSHCDCRVLFFSGKAAQVGLRSFRLISKSSSQSENWICTTERLWRAALDNWATTTTSLFKCERLAQCTYNQIERASHQVSISVGTSGNAGKTLSLRSIDSLQEIA